MSDSKGYTRLQIIADDEILKWWNDHKDDKRRQDKFREAMKIGLRVIEEELGVYDSEKAKIYDAIETLLRNGVVGANMTGPSATTTTEKKVEPGNLLRDLRGKLTE